MPELERKFKPAPSTMSESAFVKRFGGIYEYSPWIAREVWRLGLSDEHSSVSGLSAVMGEYVLTADRERLLALIRAHPDLAGRAAVSGELTEESSSEQASAGIDQCSEEEFERFQHLNEAYKKKFDFPFVMAVKGSNRHKILAAFEERLKNDPETEFQRSLLEINKIARLRLEAIAGEGQ